MFDVEVGDADPADFAFLLKTGHFGPAFFDVGIGLGPMDLVEIDNVDVKAAQAVFAFLADGGGFEGGHDFALVVPGAFAFGEDVGFVGAAFESLAYDFFGVAETVDGGGIDPVEAGIESGMDGGDGIVVILIAPGEGPAGAADSPGADAEGCNFEIAVS